MRGMSPLFRSNAADGARAARLYWPVTRRERRSCACGGTRRTQQQDSIIDASAQAAGSGRHKAWHNAYYSRERVEGLANRPHVPTTARVVRLRKTRLDGAGYVVLPTREVNAMLEIHG